MCFIYYIKEGKRETETMNLSLTNDDLYIYIYIYIKGEIPRDNYPTISRFLKQVEESHMTHRLFKVYNLLGSYIYIILFKVDN